VKTGKDLPVWINCRTWIERAKWTGVNATALQGCDRRGVTAPLPSNPGTLLAPTLAAQMITDKYQDHLPHFRPSQRFRRRHEIEIGRQTLNGWTHATARHCAPIGQAIRAELLESNEMEVDEWSGATRTGAHATRSAGVRTAASIKLPLTTSIPATAQPEKAASGLTAIPSQAPVTSTSTPAAVPHACWKYG